MLSVAKGGVAPIPESRTEPRYLILASFIAMRNVERTCCSHSLCAEALADLG